MAGRVAVEIQFPEIQFPRPTRMMSLDGLFKEGSSGEIGAEKGINGLVVLIDSPIELV